MDLISYLIANEGLRLKPYKDTVGKLTIGIGRNLDDVGISKDEALRLLDTDIQSAEKELQKHFDWYSDLDEIRKIVLLDMCFNMGIGKLIGFKRTLGLIREHKYKEAAVAMLQSEWALEVGNRAHKNALMMETGQWPK